MRCKRMKNAEKERIRNLNPEIMRRVQLVKTILDCVVINEKTG
jgi:hypothetical protein